MPLADGGHYVPALSDIDFLIIGAAKSATTSLQRALQADHSVSMPDPELHYFSREFARGDEWYLAQFPASVSAVCHGEKSNSYMESPEAVDRIVAALPRARMIAMLRDPVERAYSDYCMLYRRSEVGKDIDRALDPRQAAAGRFVVGGLYYRQLEPFFERFGADGVLVLLYEEFRADPGHEVAKVRSFLGLAPMAPAELPAKHAKDRTEPMVPPQLRRLLRRAKPLVAPIRHLPAFREVRRLVAREIRYPALHPDLRHRLAEHYRPEVDRLSALLGRDFGVWSSAGATNSAMAPDPSSRS